MTECVHVALWPPRGTVTAAEVRLVSMNLRAFRAKLQAPRGIVY